MIDEFDRWSRRIASACLAGTAAVLLASTPLVATPASAEDRVNCSARQCKAQPPNDTASICRRAKDRTRQHCPGYECDNFRRMEAKSCACVSECWRAACTRWNTSTGACTDAEWRY